MHRTTISMHTDDYKFSEEKNLNISQIVRAHIQDIRAFARSELEEIAKLQARLLVLQEEIKKRSEFLENKGLWDEFIEFAKVKQ